MKLIKKIALGYYMTHFRSLGLFSSTKAAASAFQLFCQPPSGKPKITKPAIFERGEHISCVIDGGIMLRGWRWMPENSSGNTVLILHGFDSYSYKFEKYIRPLLREGFNIMAFDGPGHGTSDGKTINSLQYKNAILTIEKKFGQLFGIIGHSMGGLAASLASEHMPSLRKLVLIAPAVEINRAINHFSKKVALPAKVKDKMYQLIVSLAQNPVSYFDVGRAVQQIKTPTLWLHDEEDSICPFEDVAPVVDLKLNHVNFFITKGLGHSNIYRDPASIKAVIAFIKN